MLSRWLPRTRTLAALGAVAAALVACGEDNGTTTIIIVGPDIEAPPPQDTQGGQDATATGTSPTDAAGDTTTGDSVTSPGDSTTGDSTTSGDGSSTGTAPDAVTSGDAIGADGTGTGTSPGDTSTGPEAGTEGGPCLTGNACLGDSLQCYAGVCREPVCLLGDIGCACYANSTCNKRVDGTWLVCDAGLCRAPTCPQGAVGCGCYPGATCDAGLFCSTASGSPRCEMATCAVGDEGCGCKPDRSCNADAGGDPLVCDGALCVAPTCDIGASGCSCRADYSCDAGLACGSDGRCGPADCARGTLGCGCLANGTCSTPGLVCGNDGTCQSPVCQQGEEGCGCFGNFTCAAPGDGTLLVCSSGTCVEAPCAPGSEGCGCFGNDTCAGAGLVCQAGFCVPTGCVAGTIGCQCLTGDCNPGATCDNGVCVDATGYPGEPCYANGTCKGANLCDDASDTCVPCAPGSADCACFANDTCNPGLVCAAGHCVSESGEIDEEQNKLDTCYSPCTEGVQLADGTYVPCSSVGLMQFCMDGTECIAGSCQPPGSVGPKPCESALDCPSFQTCIEGGCWSECEFDSQCADGLKCYQKICQEPCLASQAACPEGNACVTVDGEAGYCQPTPEPEGESVLEVSGYLNVSKEVIPFTNVRQKDAFTIYNASPLTQTITVRFIEHTYPDNDLGTTVVVNTNALNWMAMGLAAAAATPPEDTFAAEDAAVLATTVPQAQKTVTFDLGPYGQRIVVLDRATNALRPLWNGIVEVSTPKLGVRKVSLSYRSLPEGQWNGSIYYFANFRDTDIATWVASPNDIDAASDTNNAFIEKWATFRAGGITLDEFRALLQQTVTGSWDHPSVRTVCRQNLDPEDPPVGCYLYDGDPDGYVPYSNNLTTLAVPTGVVTLPLSVNLKAQGTGSSTYVGRINSDIALQYAGFPALTLRFATNPATPTCTGGNCRVNIAELDADITVGARYATSATDALCGPTGSYAVKMLPWFVPGFLRGAMFDATLAVHFKHECRDLKFPFADQEAVNANLAGANPIPDGRRRTRHIELIDGLMVDQEQLILLVREWYEPFMDELDPTSSGGAPPISAYAVIRLIRGEAQLTASDYAGNAVVDASTPTFEPGLLGQCSPDLVFQAIGKTTIDSVTDAQKVANRLIVGIDDSDTVDPLAAGTIHYYCEDTGLIDQGDPDNDAYPVPCPVGSKVTYFHAPTVTQDHVDGLACQKGFQAVAVPTGFEASVDELVCADGSDSCDVEDQIQASAQLAYLEEQPTLLVQTKGSCKVTPIKGTTKVKFEGWKGPSNLKQGNQITWLCKKPGTANQWTDDLTICDAARFDETKNNDLRKGKLYYAIGETEATLEPIVPLIEDAFRFRVKFRSNTGRPLGFVPTICEADSSLEPYCYEPETIEHVRDRLDCLLAIFTEYYPDGTGPSLNGTTLQRVFGFLETSLSYITATEKCLDQGIDPELCGQLDPFLQDDGFERHYAELLVMLGDDAFTDALGSRFDLAGISNAVFKGSLLEPGGIDLSGGVGFQMLLLYRAAQYYEMVLDRFYQLSPYIWWAGSLTPLQSFVSGRTVTSYIDRVVLASTKLARVWNEIARRYQSFNRPDLARRVVERGYTRAYLESVALTRIMQRIIDNIDTSSRPQVQASIDDGQRRYRIAMLDMAEAYGEITNEVNVFGFTPDYIPFPGLRPTDNSAVQLLLDRAWTSVNRAREQEQAALDSTRSFDTDTAQFQSELARVASTYEDQLAELCGSFEGTDGNIHPATRRYLPYLDAAKSKANLPTVVDDPCGMLPSGQIYEQRLRLEQQALAGQALIESYQRTVAEIRAVADTVQQRCNIINALANFEYERAGETIELENSIREAENDLNSFRRAMDTTISVTNSLKDIANNCFPKVFVGFPTSGTEMNTTACAASNVANRVVVAATVATNIKSSNTEDEIAGLEEEISQVQREMAWTRSQSECQYAELEATGQIRNLWSQLAEQRIQMRQQEFESQIAKAQLGSLRNRAARLESQQEDQEQLLINVEAAKNDPNVRIYQNAAVIRSDASFNEALRDVYRATRVFEYYTTQTYARKEALFLVRMVSHGEGNLEDYLIDLENEFFDFEERFGIPATRVEVLSLRDDILRIPRYDDDLAPLSQADRIALLRERITSNELIDPRGYITIPFSTTVAQLSPLTRNHKVLYLEAEVIGSDIGDPVGRVYLTQRGTGTVRPVEGDDKLFFAFPELTGVVNPFFNGQRVFNPEIYRNDRLRDRPFANTQWQIVLNQLDEQVNKDINLGSLTDVRVYVFYTDFTEL